MNDGRLGHGQAPCVAARVLLGIINVSRLGQLRGVEGGWWFIGPHGIGWCFAIRTMLPPGQMPREAQLRWLAFCGNGVRWSPRARGAA